MPVYLIHFSRPIGNPNNPRGQARHYIGYTQNLEERLEAHRRGEGSAIMAAVVRCGIDWTVVAVWPDGGRDLERRLKQKKAAPRLLCPICREERRTNGR